MPKVGPAARHIRDIEALTLDDLPLRMRRSIYHCHINKLANVS